MTEWGLLFSIGPRPTDRQLRFLTSFAPLATLGPIEAQVCLKLEISCDWTAQCLQPMKG